MSDDPAAVVVAERRLRIPRRLPSGAIVYVGFVLIFVVLRHHASATTGFLTVDNQLNILRQTAFVSVMAFGTTFALSAGEIDLSIGSVVALSAMVTAVLLRDANAFVAVPAGLVVGLVVGLVNGLLTTRLRVPSFLITLGMAGIVGGLSRWITNLQPVPVLDDGYTYVFGSGNVGPAPHAVPVDHRGAGRGPRRLPQDHLRPRAARDGRQPDRRPLLGDQHLPHPRRVARHLLDDGGAGRPALRRPAPQRPVHARRAPTC